MRLIPAIDIIDGQCVRLTKGDYSTKKVYNENPLEVAKMFQDSGIEYLHLVDLDGAKAKQQKLQIWVERGGKEKLIDFQKLPTYQKAGWIPLGSEEDKPEKRKPLVKQRESVMVEGARIQHIEDLVPDAEC